MLHITKLERLATGLYEENECCEYVTRGCTDNTYILHNLLIDPISKVVTVYQAGKVSKGQTLYLILPI